MKVVLIKRTSLFLSVLLGSMSAGSLLVAQIEEDPIDAIAEPGGLPDCKLGCAEFAVLRVKGTGSNKEWCRFYKYTTADITKSSKSDNALNKEQRTGLTDPRVYYGQGAKECGQCSSECETNQDATARVATGTYDETDCMSNSVTIFRCVRKAAATETVSTGH